MLKCFGNWEPFANTTDFGITLCSAAALAESCEFTQAALLLPSAALLLSFGQSFVRHQLSLSILYLL